MKAVGISLKIFIFFTVLTGVLYPVFITVIANAAFPFKANGSIIIRDSTAVGSMLIGQEFDSPAYFSSRPSAVFYNPLPSGGTNLGLTNPKLKALVAERKSKFITYNQLDSLEVIPSEMLFASASGLDPHISPGAALLQVNRIAGERKFTGDQRKELTELIISLSEHPQFHLFGQYRINVFLLNLNLDEIK